VSVLINPGSGPVANSGTGWTNTYEGALAEARRWLAQIRDEGIADVELVVPDQPVQREGRWVFGFRHLVTGVVVELETHGIDNMAHYTAQRIFDPRVYWRGSSCASPDAADWAALGYVQTYRRAS
jgi:hypothetical protein